MIDNYYYPYQQSGSHLLNILPLDSSNFEPELLCLGSIGDRRGRDQSVHNLMYVYN